MLEISTHVTFQASSDFFLTKQFVTVVLNQIAAFVFLLENNIIECGNNWEKHLLQQSLCNLIHIDSTQGNSNLGSKRDKPGFHGLS